MRRGAHSFFEVSRQEPSRLGLVRRAVASGSSGARLAVAVAIVILGVTSAGVLRVNGDRHVTAPAPGAAELALAQIGPAGLAPPKASPTVPSIKASTVRGKAVSTLLPAPSPAPIKAFSSAPVTPNASPAATPVATPVAVAAAKPVPAADPIIAYRGLGSWVDWYDYGHAESMDPAAVVGQLAQQGVRTLFLQTGLWSQGPDILYPAAVNAYLDLAHAKGIRVVGWYVPGFADIDHDVRASLAVLTYASPTGQHFDGFAADIEDRSAIEQAGRRTSVSAVEVLARFNAGIAEYSRRLHRAVPPGTALGAVVPDARNNESSAPYWAGFPWPAMAANYDVVLPMAYWSVNKPAACPAADAGAYIRDVVAKTQALMGTPKPMHPIGGIADCVRAQDVTTYVDATKAAGSIGGGLYSFLTTRVNPEQAALWAILRRLNG